MMGMMMTSCQKNESLSKETFTATTESNAKTHLDGLSLKWDDEGESIMVKGENGSMAEYFATSVTNNGTCATFACEVGQEVSSSEFMIYYPASMMSATATYPQLPAEQEYAENSVKGFPMYAVTQSHAFQFTNLCGLFRLQLQKTGVSVRSITITTNKAVNGTFEVGTSAEGAFQFAAYETNDDAQKSVTLDCGVNGVSIDDLTDFNIYLPVGEYNTFDITITATDGSVCTKSLNGNSLTINRNERVTLTRQGEALEFAEDAIDGLFTIDAQGTQVHFAKGNLDYNGSYFFAANQYDYGGYFGWGTGNNPTCTSDNPSDYVSFDNWGDYIDGGWYTLNSAQWNYVLSRENWSLCGTATVCGVHGLILLPDEWDFTSLPFTAGCMYFQNGWDANEYDATTTPTWAQMEAAGAIFLPAAGKRYGTTMYNVGNSGHYWSSSPYTRFNGYAIDANFDDSDVAFSNSMGCFGNSVRLVTNAD